MKITALLTVLIVGLLAGLRLELAKDGDACIGALHAQAQERQTPPGEWCQRQARNMSKKAHACSCHQHSCTDEDPNHVSAHTDNKCLNYCHQHQCRCLQDDCP